MLLASSALRGRGPFAPLDETPISCVVEAGVRSCGVVSIGESESVLVYRHSQVFHS